MRRRGEELETALLEAAWEQLGAEGYGGFTFDAVALRAGTSKPVLYRRWPNRETLLLAVLQHRRILHAVATPDTGSLRTDVIELLRSATHLRASMVTMFSLHLGAYFAETGKTPASLRNEILGVRTSALETIVARAVDRGEIPAGLPQRIVTLPFDLFRHEALMTLSEVPDDVILEIVDKIFLPLVTSQSPTTDSAESSPS